ncbi:hypothetical protein BT69DRAFT_394163 [Atractiella rhizophila]|nr:hypothetical protein BT69DRAFT_394163 [Atractiella rhizophila]
MAPAPTTAQILSSSHSGWAPLRLHRSTNSTSSSGSPTSSPAAASSDAKSPPLVARRTSNSFSHVKTNSLVSNSIFKQSSSGFPPRDRDEERKGVGVGERKAFVPVKREGAQREMALRSLGLLDGGGTGTGGAAVQEKKSMPSLRPQPPREKDPSPSEAGGTMPKSNSWNSISPSPSPVIPPSVSPPPPSMTPSSSRSSLDRTTPVPHTRPLSAFTPSRTTTSTTAANTPRPHSFARNSSSIGMTEEAPRPHRNMGAGRPSVGGLKQAGKRTFLGQRGAGKSGLRPHL